MAEGLRQLAAFLKAVDPTQTWAGLSLVDISGSVSAGAADDSNADTASGTPSDEVLWVCKACLAGRCGTAAGAHGKEGKGSSRANANTAKQLEALQARVRQLEADKSALTLLAKTNGLLLPGVNFNTQGGSSTRWGDSSTAGFAGTSIRRRAVPVVAVTAAEGGSWLGCLPRPNSTHKVHPAP
jgi:hypothetical protein